MAVAARVDARRAWLGAAASVAPCWLGPAARLVAASHGLARAVLGARAGRQRRLARAWGAWLAWSAWRVDAATVGPRLATGSWALAGLTLWAAAFAWEAAGHSLPPAVAVWRQVAQGVVFLWMVDRASTGQGRGLWPVLAHPVAQYVGRIKQDG